MKSGRLLRAHGQDVPFGNDPFLQPDRLSSSRRGAGARRVNRRGRTAAVQDRVHECLLRADTQAAGLQQLQLFLKHSAIGGGHGVVLQEFDLLRRNVNSFSRQNRPLGKSGVRSVAKTGGELAERLYAQLIQNHDLNIGDIYRVIGHKRALCAIALLQARILQLCMAVDAVLLRENEQTRFVCGGTDGIGPYAGCCHSFSADGRCITLLKVLMTNRCVFDCKYCVNRRSNDTRRAAFTPRELAELTIGFYRRNYIEGLFLSSGVLRSPDYTTERMIECLRILREEYRFNGYIHAKAIPGTSPELVQRLGLLADRLSVNIELPSQKGLQTLAPDKSKQAILRPMAQIRDRARESKAELVKSRHAPVFAPAGQSTQLIVGATADNDRHILHLTQSLYEKYRLKRVFYSAYVPVVENSLLPSKDTKPPLLREHRLYQADWLLRFYGFRAEELLDEQHPDFNPLVDPKCHWAIGHLEQFPLEIMNAEYETLLRVPGIGPISARRIVSARRHGTLRFEDLKKLGVVLKRAQFFITCGGRMRQGLQFTAQTLQRQLEAMERGQLPPEECLQLSLFDSAG